VTRLQPSYDLHIAIREAIQAHANHYRGGEVNGDKALAALSDAATKLLAEIPDTTQRIMSANALTIGIARTVRTQSETEGEIDATHQ
jgi:hypothetical protein